MRLPNSKLGQVQQSTEGDLLNNAAPCNVSKKEDEPRKEHLDGVSALLRAGEIVERHDRYDVI